MDKESNITLEDYVRILNQYQELQQRIYETIEYIKKWGCYEEDMKVFCDDIDYYNLPRLLEILKGEPNNDNV